MLVFSKLDEMLITLFQFLISLDLRPVDDGALLRIQVCDREF